MGRISSEPAAILAILSGHTGFEVDDREPIKFVRGGVKPRRSLLNQPMHLSQDFLVGRRINQPKVRAFL
jgi:hypothetical protein